MTSDKDILEQRLETEYAEALDAMHFTGEEKARMAERIAAEASRSLARSRVIRENDPRKMNEPRKNSQLIKANDPRKMKTASEKNSSLFRKSPAAIAAALAICVILPLTALATSGNLEGFLKDKVRFDGAITGQSYEQATDEIGVMADVENGKLIVTATFAESQKPPYCTTEKLGINAYQILDVEGKVVAEGSADSVEVENGRVTIDVSLDGIVPGDYTLNVSSFVSEAKADQPLVISGSWKCGFSR